MILRELTMAVKGILTSASPEQISEARRWTADCEGYPAGDMPPVPYAAGYVVRYYPGGWDAFVSECCTYVTLFKS